MTQLQQQKQRTIPDRQTTMLAEAGTRQMRRTGGILNKNVMSQKQVMKSTFPCWTQHPSLTLWITPTYSKRQEHRSSVQQIYDLKLHEIHGNLTSKMLGACTDHGTEVTTKACAIALKGYCHCSDWVKGKSYTDSKRIGKFWTAKDLDWDCGRSIGLCHQFFFWIMRYLKALSHPISNIGTSKPKSWPTCTLSSILTRYNVLTKQFTSELRYSKASSDACHPSHGLHLWPVD